MRLLLIVCIAASSAVMMAMQEDFAAAQPTVQQPQKDWREGVKSKWDAAVCSNGQSPWFKAPALDAIVHATAYNGETAAIMQRVAGLFEMFEKRNTQEKEDISFSYIHSLCNRPDAQIICPQVKAAYDAFMNKKDTASAQQALTLLTKVIEETFAPNLIPLTKADALSNHLTSLEQQLVAYKKEDERIHAACKQAKEGCESINPKPRDQAEKIEATLRKVRTLQGQGRWRIKDCDTICSLEYDITCIKRVIDENERALTTIKKRVEAFKQLDVKIRAQDSNKRVAEIISITALLVGTCYALFSSKKKEQDKQPYECAR